MTMRLQSPLTHTFTIFEKIQPFIFQLSKLDQVSFIYSFSSSLRLMRLLFKTKKIIDSLVTIYSMS